MSVAHRSAAGPKIVLTDGPESAWETIARDYCAQDPLAWKRLAILQLRADGWTMEAIGAAFGHPRGHICRTIHKTIAALRDQFDLPPLRPADSDCAVGETSDFSRGESIRDSGFSDPDRDDG